MRRETMLANPVKIKYGKIFNQYIIDLSSNNLLLTKEVLASFLNNFNNDVVKKELVPSSCATRGKGKDKENNKYISLIIRILFEDSK